MRELVAIRAAWEQATSTSSCQVVTVIGEAGVGKSRLVAEALDSTNARAGRDSCCVGAGHLNLKLSGGDGHRRSRSRQVAAGGGGARLDESASCSRFVLRGSRPPQPQVVRW